MDSKKLMEKLMILSQKSDELLEIIKQLSESDLSTEIEPVRLMLRRLSQEYDACQKELKHLPSDNFSLMCSTVIRKEQEWISQISEQLKESRKCLKNAQLAAAEGSRAGLENMLNGGRVL